MKVSILAVALVVGLSGCAGFMAYKEGTHVSAETQGAFVVGKSTTEDVKNNIGFPSDITKDGDLTNYVYYYTEINHIAPNKNEKVVFVFKKNGTLQKIYSDNSGATTSSNPLLQGFK